MRDMYQSAAAGFKMYDNATKFIHSRILKLFLGIICILLFTNVMSNIAHIQWRATINTRGSRPNNVSNYITSLSYKDGRRLGNVLFTYASLLGIARRNRKKLILPDSFPLVKYFDLKIKLLPEKVIKKDIQDFQDFTEFKQRACAYDPATESLPADAGINLHGYLQSWKYFYQIKDELRENLRFKHHILDETRKFIHDNTPQHMRSKDVVYVGVHSRRSDMASWQNWWHGYTTAPPEYFNHSMEYFQKKYPKVVFVVCSDNIEWTKQNIPHQNVIFSNFTSPALDLALLSQCNHTITSVGSFGWWAAWMVNGTTTYYKNWPHPGSRIDKQVNKEDYFPPGWIAMT